MRHSETSVTQKGQVTIPAPIRARLGLKPRDKVRFEIVGDVVQIRPVQAGILRGFGAVTPHQQPEDWRRVREIVEESIGEEAAAEGTHTQ